MSFYKRLKLYLLGFIISSIFVLFLFGDRMFSWSYFPNDRVLAEIKIRTIEFSSQSQNYLQEKKHTKTYITDTVLVKGKINFDESNAQVAPCPNYTLYYDNLKVTFTKCKEKVTIDSIN